MELNTGFTDVVATVAEAVGGSLVSVGHGQPRGGGGRGHGPRGSHEPHGSREPHGPHGPRGPRGGGRGARGGANGVGGRGLGVVIATDRVLTNAHNLRDETTSVRFADGRTDQARLVGLDADGDLAVLGVSTADAAPLTWAEGDAVTMGAFVVALGFASGGTLRATVGTVSAVGQTFRGPRGRRVRGAFEHTASLARGSSGGPVLNHDGHLVGISTSRLGGGFYLALPADAALRERVDSLGRGEQVERVRLGVGLAPSSVAQRLRASVGLEPREGLLVQEVGTASPAEAAGLRAGDLLVALDGVALTEAEELLSALDGLHPGASIRLGVVRGAAELDAEVLFPADEDEGGDEGGGGLET